MRKTFLVICFSLITVNLSFATDYMKSEIYRDITLSKVSLPVESDIQSIMSPHPEKKNVILNYFISLEFNKGVVSVEQQQAYKIALTSLDAPIREEINKVYDRYMSLRSYKLRVVDLRSFDYFLPLKIIETDFDK